MKLEQSLNINIVDENKPEPVVIDKDELLADVPLDDGDVSEQEVDLGLEFVAKPKPDISDIFDDKPVINEVADEVSPEPAPVVKVVKEDVP